jgi:hypothetical protein
MSLRSLAPFVRFIFLSFSLPDGLWTTDELNESGVAGGSQWKVSGRNYQTSRGLYQI